MDGSPGQERSPHRDHERDSEHRRGARDRRPQHHEDGGEDKEHRSRDRDWMPHHHEQEQEQKTGGTSLMKKMIMPGNKGILFADSGGGAHKMCFESGCLGKYSYHEEDR